MDLSKKGIYKIIIKNYFYIGSTMVDFNYRKGCHLRELKNKKHANNIMQNLFNKYGEKNFIFEIVETCENNIREREQYYIDLLKPNINISKFAIGPMSGRKHSELAKSKMKNREPWNRGIKRTDEEKKKMSDVKLYRNSLKSQEHWNKISQNAKDRGLKPFLGKSHTPENKKILRDAHKDKKGKIICLNNNEIFEAQIDIQRKYGIKQGHVSEVLNGKRIHVKGYMFKYLENETPKYKKRRAYLIKDNKNNIFTSLTKALKYHNLIKAYQKINKYLRNNLFIQVNNLILEKYEP